MVFDRLCQCIRLGFVTARQPEKMRLQVEIKDSPGGSLVTKFLPMLTPRATGDMQYDLPDIGDQVLVLFLPYALEQGFVLGAMYGGNNPPTTNPEVWHRTFADGTVLEYDRGAHKLKADVKGELEAKATGVAALKSEKQVILDAPLVFVRGTLVNTARDGGAGNAVISGDVKILNGGVEAAADVVGAGVSLASHLHTGVQTGSGTSGAPVAGAGDSSGNGSGDCADAPTAMTIIPCLPAIAENMALTEENNGNADDAKGWRYLSAMFKKWLNATAPVNADEYQSPFYVDWDWVMKFTRAATAYNHFTTDSDEEPGRNIYSEASRKQLALLLSREGFF